MLKRLSALAAVIGLALVLGACGKASSSDAASAGSGSSSGPCAYPTDTSVAPSRQVSAPPSTPVSKGDVPFTMTTSVGTITGTLNGGHAPCTVNSFVSLAHQHFFDNTPCHRLTTSGIFVLQCGDPTGTGTGGPGYTIPDELTGHEKYPAGTIAMANTGQPNSGGSQFFLVYRNTQLHPQYTVFGHLSPAGLKVVQKVAAKGSDNAFGPGDGHPNEKVTITHATTG